jgi:hypothetical protein
VSSIIFLSSMSIISQQRVSRTTFFYRAGQPSCNQQEVGAGAVSMHHYFHFIIIDCKHILTSEMQYFYQSFTESEEKDFVFHY